MILDIGDWNIQHLLVVLSQVAIRNSIANYGNPGIVIQYLDVYLGTLSLYDQR